MWADLHMHSRVSDGSLTPEELVKLCADRGLTHFSITDHDSVYQQDKIAPIAASLGLEYIRGIEISAYDTGKNRRIHILGYGYGLPASNIEALCAPVSTARDSLTRRQTEILHQSGYSVSIEEVEAEAEIHIGNRTESVLYKQHIMAVLTRKGIVDGLYGNSYKKLFKGTGPCALEITYPDVHSAVRAIRDDGGFPVLAHPQLQDSLDLVDELCDSGLAGIELNHESNGHVFRNEILQIAASRGLFLSGGSDFHGKYGGTAGPGDIVCPASFFSSSNPLLG